MMIEEGKIEKETIKEKRMIEEEMIEETEETEATIEEEIEAMTEEATTEDPLQETVIDIIQKNEIIHHLGIIHTIKINLENMIIEIRQYQIVLHEGEVLLHIIINFNLFFYVNLPFLTYSCYNKQFNNNNNNILFNASYE